jgi:YhcN/YlaJ family sporulation lipoprotein
MLLLYDSNVKCASYLLAELVEFTSNRGGVITLRKSLLLTAVLLSSAIAMSGCLGKTGDVGNKNIRSEKSYGMNGNGMTKMRFANDQDNDQNRMYGERRENNNVIGMHGNSRLEMSNRVADKLAALPEIDSAFVMMTDHNAYVAVKQNHKVSSKSVAMTDALKDKVADQVKSMSPSVENVYVSTNPDFTKRMQVYSQDAREGHPIQGFLAEFNALVERVFPASSGTRNR